MTFLSYFFKLSINAGQSPIGGLLMRYGNNFMRSTGAVTSHRAGCLVSATREPEGEYRHEGRAVRGMVNA